MRVEAFHDRALNARAADDVRKHLDDCAACMTALNELRELSSQFADLYDEPVRRATMVRIHRAVDAADRDGGGVLRIAGLLAGLAASVVVVGSAWLYETPTPVAPVPQQIVIGPGSVHAAESWERLAMNLEPNPSPVAGWEGPSRQAVAEARLAEWILKNL